MEISTLENLVELVRCQMELHVLNLTILSLPYPRVSPCRPHTSHQGLLSAARYRWATSGEPGTEPNSL